MAGEGTEFWTEVSQVLLANLGVSPDLEEKQSTGSCLHVGCVVQGKALKLSGLLVG